MVDFFGEHAAYVAVLIAAVIAVVVILHFVFQLGGPVWPQIDVGCLRNCRQLD